MYCVQKIWFRLGITGHSCLEHQFCSLNETKRVKLHPKGLTVGQGYHVKWL